jgi:hypothetical protein
MNDPLAVRSNNRALKLSAAAGVSLLDLGGFSLSFSSLRDLAIASDIDPRLAFVWPLIVDGFIVVATAAAFALKRRGRRVTWYPWAAVILFSAISVAGNSLHAVDARRLLVPVPVAAVVSSVPTLALLISSHLLVVMIDGTIRAKSQTVTSSATEHSGPLDARENTSNARSPIVREVEPAFSDVLPQLRKYIEEGGVVTGAVVARIAQVSERTGRRRLEQLRRRFPELFAGENMSVISQ